MALVLSEREPRSAVKAGRDHRGDRAGGGQSERRDVPSELMRAI